MPSNQETNLLLLMNQVAPVPSLNGYTDLYLSDLDNAPVFEEIGSSDKNVNPINTYFVVTPIVALVSTPPKVIKKRCKTRHRKNIDTIKIPQLENTTSAIFLSTALHSVSQATTCNHTDKIALYNKSDTDCCAASGSSTDMFPDYSIFKIHQRLSN